MQHHCDMADYELQQTHHFSEFSFPHSIPRQQNNHASHNVGMLPAASNAQPESQTGYVPPAIGNGAMQDRVPDPHRINVSNYRMVDYSLLPDQEPAFPHMQGQQANDIFGYAPQDDVPSTIQAAFPDSSVHHTVAGQPVVENLRRLASRYVHRPDSRIDMVRMEAAAAGRYKVVIVLEMADFL